MRAFVPRRPRCVGAYGEPRCAAALETLVVERLRIPFVRRNAAWALGKIGQLESRRR